ncbi:GMC oxidoreductase [Cognaticolwellia beringensis]|uniref:GMC family oxidoreductase n=1 Tax=Cognaticolwellia beringensis TaxID=1967665 RepID=A0A222GBT3_9GAMM|nr:GMC family oxidoreductase [Cognaticolwellia beringensis]ASP49348.1 GMC family oxidoreductase [Cognaticolwellia beringensis]
MKEQVYINKTSEVYDAIVIGSGISGGWAAKELCERGLKTLMIERGRVVEHRKDYTGENTPMWRQEHRGRVENLLTDQQHSVQKQCYAFGNTTKQFFGNDRDLPYQTKEGTTFSWIRGNQLGGKSLTWHRQCYRLGEYDFNANKVDGYGTDWPIRSKDIEKWYSHVEIHAGISGSKENLPNLPDSEFLPPFEMMTIEKDMQEKFSKLYPERPMIMGRTAHLTQPTDLHISQGRIQCQARNECHAGCSYGAYFSTQSSTLPAAAKTGNLHIAPNSVVHSLIYDEKTNRVKGVRVIDNDDLSEREYFANVIFVCASTIGSTQILMNSISKKFPNGIANSSGVLGHYLMDHNFNGVASGEVEGYENEYYKGRRPTGLMIPNFFYKPDRQRDFLRGYALHASAYREGWEAQQAQDGLGVEYKNKLKQAGKWHFQLAAQGEMLPRFENQMRLHPSLKDKWGIPQIEFDVRFSDNEKMMMEDAVEQSIKMLKAAGLKNVSGNTMHGPPGLAIHELGTARMGRDAKTSILNGFNQSHDIPNLFVTDGASFCSSAVQNPSLTFMALTARAVDYAVKEIAAKRI